MACLVDCFAAMVEFFGVFLGEEPAEISGFGWAYRFETLLEANCGWPYLSTCMVERLMPIESKRCVWNKAFSMPAGAMGAI